MRRNKYVSNWGLHEETPTWKKMLETAIGFIIMMALGYGLIVLLWAAVPDPFYG